MANQANQNKSDNSSRTDGSNPKTKNDDKVDIEITKEEEIILDRTPKEKENPQAAPPQSRDEQSVSGHMPDPKKDDDALEAAKKTGLYTEATEEKPVKVGIAQQVEKAEEERRSKKNE